jgi:23S rRNA (cytosine1962-C5)-methyltransferase
VADGAPGLYVDAYADLLVVHADDDQVLQYWRGALEEESGAFAAAVAKVHPREASRQAVRELTLWGTPPEELTVTERGVRYLIKPRVGLNVGLFLDMREVRTWLRSVAGGARVLNLFAYTCSLGVCASLSGASRVLNLDLSKAYLEWGKHNYSLNDLPVSDQDFVYGDAFDWLTRFAKRHQRFDLVIVDPPSFSSTRSSSFSVERDYQRLIAVAAHCVASGGILLVATNHAGTTDVRFDAWLRSGLDAAQRRGQLAHRWHEPSEDFPLPPARRPYLKVRAVVLE